MSEDNDEEDDDDSESDEEEKPALDVWLLLAFIECLSET